MEQGSKNPLPCANNCGFYGSPATRNLCSKCFRLAEAEAAAETAVVTSTGSSSSSSSAAASAELGTEAVEHEESRRGGATRRCAACRRKVGLMGFECRCGGVFCTAHRYSDRHDCDYDYRTAGRDAIARSNPVVRADKQVDRL